MRIWVSLPTNFQVAYAPRRTACEFSTAQEVPPKSWRMEKDGLDWFEVEVIRNATEGQHWISKRDRPILKKPLLAR